MKDGLRKLIRSAGRAYQSKCAPATEPENEQRDGLFVLRNYLRGQADHGALETDSGLTIGEVAELLASHEQHRHDHIALGQAEQSASSCWERVDSALAIIRDTARPFDKRLRLAAYELELIGDQGGPGKDRVDHERIAAHYHTLRTGGGWIDEQGATEALAPLNHADAVLVIERTYSTDWESLRRAWRRKKIQVSTDAEAFPIK